jgi:anti-sigma factor RsiW
MKCCPEYEEMVVLDAHGELGSGARAAWETHLRDCTACREERLRLTKMLEEVRETLRHPAVTRRQSETLARSVRAELSGAKKAAGGWREFFFGRPRRLMPAMASLCVVVIAFYMFGLRTVEGPARIQTESDSKPWAELKAEDLEIIKNMDLLREMDWVQKLVQAFDELDDGTPTSRIPGNAQESFYHEGHRHYA